MHDLLNDPHLVGVPVIDGFKVLDPCVLFARLGQGGMGAVYRGKHLNLDIDVAVKCLKRSLAEESPELVQRFEREAKIAAKINSDGLVRVYDVGRQFGINYFVMEMIVGETLTQRVRRKGPLPIHEAAAIIARAARGLSDAHELGIIHRDIKPDNVMITVRGQVKVADLGLARAKEAMDSLQTHSRMVMGTPQFMPIEQFAGAAQTSPASDVYSLGATLYFMLAGQPPFAGASMTEIMYQVANTRFPNVLDTRPDCPIELAAIINESTQREASRRYADAMKFATAVEEFLFSQHVNPNLADPGASASTKTGDLVSPPPVATMARIRSAVRELKSDAGMAEALRSNESPGPTKLASEFRTFDTPTPVPGMPPAATSDASRRAEGARSPSSPAARTPSSPPPRPPSSPPIPPIISTPPPLPAGRISTPPPAVQRSDPGRISSPIPQRRPVSGPAPMYDEALRSAAPRMGGYPEREPKTPFSNRWWLIPVLFFGALGVGILIVLMGQELA